MANLTDERIKEMEEEMNRFEEEILTSQLVPGAVNGGNVTAKAAPPSSKPDIGPITLERVQAHLASKPLAPPPPPPPPSTVALKSAESIPKSVLAAALIPPPPPPPESQIGPQLPQNSVNVPRLAPPPPPPSFVPPQLRHRPPMAPPPRMPVLPHIMPGGGPPGGSGPPMHPGMMAPPPPPPHMLRTPPGLPPGAFHRPMIPPAMTMPMLRPPAMGMPATNYGFAPSCPPVTSEPSRSEPMQVTPTERPKVVYAAPPVRASGTVTDESGCLGSVVRTEVVVKATHQNASSITSEPKYSARGIELNVPVEKIEAEKKQNSSVVQPSAVAASVEASAVSSTAQAAANKKEKKDKKKKYVRMAAGTVWEDPTLAEWDTDDFRLFCGDLGNEVTDDILTRAFNRYPSFQRARVVRDKRTNKTKGYGFVSFKDPNDFARAMREMNGKYVGNRPIKLRKSAWQDRQIDIVKKKDKEKKRLGFR